MKKKKKTTNEHVTIPGQRTIRKFILECDQIWFWALRDGIFAVESGQQSRVGNLSFSGGKNSKNGLNLTSIHNRPLLQIEQTNYFFPFYGMDTK